MKNEIDFWKIRLPAIIGRVQKSKEKTRQKWISNTSRHVERLLKAETTISARLDDITDEREKERLRKESEILRQKINRIITHFRQIWRFWECLEAFNEENGKNWFN
ncbi:MAG: hypothetical protein QXI89_00430 [Candidatus Anstonellales archaeon]